MDSLSEIVDVVIGVDTHVSTHSAAILDVRTGGVLAEITVEATPDGYEELVAFADEHSGLRAWAIEGTGSHGAGLARHLAKNDEFIVELDRPERAKRRSGAKSDPLDAIRAAHEALSRTKLGTPRSTGERQALSVLLAARRSAVEAAKEAQQQLFALVIAAPDVLRSKLRGKRTLAMARIASRLRFRADWDLETRTTASVLRDLARRALELWAEADRHEKEILRIVWAWRPELLERRGVGPIVAATVLCRVVASGTDPLRGRFRHARRGSPDPSELRADDDALPPQPLRRPPAQSRLSHRRPVPDALGRGHSGLRQAPHRRGEDLPRDQALPEALRRS